MDYTTLRIESNSNGTVATITLDRPEVLHALNATMFDELEALFTELVGDPALRCILITGSGERAFAAGADIRGLADTDADTGEEKSRRGQRVFRQIEQCGIPTLACINGVALGGGCELAMACTLRFAASHAKLGLPEAKLGLIPGYGGTQRLTRLVGRGNALRMMLTGEFVSAAEAYRMGLVNEVIEPGALLDRAQEVAAQIVAVAPLAVRAAMEVMDRTEGIGLDAGLQVEAEVFGRLCATEDKREGIEAFLGKRATVWGGR